MEMRSEAAPRLVEAFWHDGTRYLARVDPNYQVAVFIRRLNEGERVPDAR